MNNRPKQSNPWNKNKPPKIAKTNGEIKFKEAQTKLQAAVQKHVKDYDSSSEEEDILESSGYIDNILKKYTDSGGKNDQLGRTHKILEDSFKSGAATCLICISKVKRNDEIWSCTSCYAYFHLLCIQRWSKDTITQQKLALEAQIVLKPRQINWCCPKCRSEFDPNDVPTNYNCFCGKTTNPTFQPFLIPHSCGEICTKDLLPKCGHKCLLLCHPGPCPPCPVVVKVTCYCGSQSPTAQRCSSKEWSCGNPCGKPLKCGKHRCSDTCHSGDCNPCPKKSVQRCLCKSEQKLRDCASPIWQCEKICKKPLDCGHHQCEVVCHGNGCGECALSQPRKCPCGSTDYMLPCTEETPTCNDTCNKLLDCGMHSCNQRCHKDKCGQCLETVQKSCRCGLHLREVQCSKPYLCETKCKNMRDCNKHPCNRKCCDGNCSPCEKPCARTLNCTNHKCASICHRGPCYPCNQTEAVYCRCGTTRIQVPCGRKHKTKPPKCDQQCKIPPDCHHKEREKHRCHFGDCPNCKQICNKPLADCSHMCPLPCHSAVLVKIKGEKASMPWEQTKPQVERKELPCSDCKVPLMVTCLGGHETASFPCYLAKPSSCQRPCGRLLACTNHTCTFVCHQVDSAVDSKTAGDNCEVCENPCSKARPEGCQHSCPKPCHPRECPSCTQLLRIRCHCGLTQPYIECNKWLNVENREQLQSCANQCPKNYPCGHRCKANCHSGECPNANLCKKKIKVSCKCKRIKKDFSCDSVRNKKALVECDELCDKKKSEEKQLREAANVERQRLEELKNKKELEKYQKLFEGKKKQRDRRQYDEEEDVGFIYRYKVAIMSSITFIIAIILFFVLNL